MVLRTETDTLSRFRRSRPWRAQSWPIWLLSPTISIPPSLRALPRFRCELPGPWKDYYNRLVAQKINPANHRRLACLLNLYLKMKATILDTEAGAGTAWDFVHSVFRIDQDRMFAQVKPELPVEEILQRLEQSAIFATHDASHHNIAQPERFEKHPVSFKTDKQDPVASLQLFLF